MAAAVAGVVGGVGVVVEERAVCVCVFGAVGGRVTMWGFYIVYVVIDVELTSHSISFYE